MTTTSDATSSLGTESGHTDPVDTASGTPDSTGAGTASGTPDATAERIWRNLRTYVLERNERRKETSEALGMSFFRIKVLRRVAASPARLSELAAELSSDRPYTTLVVDDLAKRGLVERHEHPTDRRSKIVTATAEGHAAADRANAIMGAPPESLSALSAADLTALDRIVAALAAQD
ncbi:MarR family winged helix-turn-helix transcriptional regulator [Streptomyces sp. CBMA29]|uniref:MarR family winged helix-turn-helix transcriptional regulator n=1 Tax=Streptomyces sp. CBMA29 TaxID=1896314 RepID=UPI001661BE0D|nr:MarR family transcriptional regulator [Streptomyces sp. CBMA29]